MDHDSMPYEKEDAMQQRGFTLRYAQCSRDDPFFIVAVSEQKAAADLGLQLCEDLICSSGVGSKRHAHTVPEQFGPPQRYPPASRKDEGHEFREFFDSTGDLVFRWHHADDQMEDPPVVHFERAVIGIYLRSQQG